ncbi:hypothetical protein [uncultured Methanoregula sp.]
MVTIPHPAGITGAGGRTKDEFSSPDIDPDSMDKHYAAGHSLCLAAFR